MLVKDDDKIKDDTTTHSSKNITPKLFGYALNNRVKEARGKTKYSASFCKLSYAQVRRDNMIRLRVGFQETMMVQSWILPGSGLRPSMIFGGKAQKK